MNNDNNDFITQFIKFMNSAEKTEDLEDFSKDLRKTKKLEKQISEIIRLDDDNDPHLEEWLRTLSAEDIEEMYEQIMNSEAEEMSAMLFR